MAVGFDQWRFHFGNGGATFGKKQSEDLFILEQSYLAKASMGILDSTNWEASVQFNSIVKAGFSTVKLAPKLGFIENLPKNDFKY